MITAYTFVVYEYLQSFFENRKKFNNYFVINSSIYCVFKGM